MGERQAGLEFALNKRRGSKESKRKVLYFHKIANRRISCSASNTGTFVHKREPTETIITPIIEKPWNFVYISAFHFH